MRPPRRFNHKQGVAVGVTSDGRRGTVRLQSGEELPFDYAVIAAGSSYPGSCIKPSYTQAVCVPGFCAGLQTGPLHMQAPRCAACGTNSAAHRSSAFSMPCLLCRRLWQPEKTSFGRRTRRLQRPAAWRLWVVARWGWSWLQRWWTPGPARRWVGQLAAPLLLIRL